LSAPNHSNGVHLAYFSSRGPTLDGRTKPDVVAPGVSITAADAANTSGYITYSGTSMATPFVSGTVALALDADPGWTPTQVRSAVEGTAQGRGPSGKDDDWGAGLLDGMAVVAQAAGGAGTTAFPAHTRIDASVADHGTWTYEFSLGSGDLGTPIGVTIIIDGQLECVLWWGSLCLQQNWGPDLDAQLIAPNGSVIDESTCTADTACGVGRQETLATMPTVEGTYTIKVYPWEGEPFNGRGGSFGVDLSAGSTVAPAPSPSPSPPPPPPPTIHVGDIDDTSAPYNSKQWTARARFEVHDGAEAVVAGVRVNVAWQNGKTANCTTNTNGRCSVSRRVTVKKATFSVSVTGLVLSGYNYVSSDNHDPDGDSDGTSITLHRP
jgi:serine protease AprX